MKFQELAKELKISLDSIQQFIEDFELNVGDCVCPNFDAQPDFEKFARENIKFLKDYEKDLGKEKSIEEIAKKIKQPIDKIKELLSTENTDPILDAGDYKTTVSSFRIDHKLGGNYRFIYDYFGTKTLLEHRDFIGYSDLFFYITDVLEPFIDPNETINWGIYKPAGIILYGPPGSGKIFWAHKIASIIGYELSTVKRHYLGSSYVPGHKFTFNEFLMSMMKKEHQAVLVEDFDKVMIEESEECGDEELEVKEIILNYVDKFAKENFLMIGSSNTMATLDKEGLAPGRFDVLIPVFPPNVKERTEIILYSMTKRLADDSLLLKILRTNKADQLEFWTDCATKMKAYSNTMVIDFTQILKKLIRSAYKKMKSEEIQISQDMLDNALRESTVKLTEEYLNWVQQFIFDVSLNNPQDFPVRLITLQTELNAYKIQEQPDRPIGFHKNEEQP